jgi:hypothetical protein
MPVTVGFQGNVLRIQCVGEYEPEEVTKGFLGAIEDSSCPKRLSLLLDLTESLSLQRRTPDEIRYVAEFLGPYAERLSGRCAVVVGTTLAYGFSRLGSVYTERIGIESEIFREADSALAWLGAANPIG